jgi:type VI secretion system secreted protein Hcp
MAIDVTIELQGFDGESKSTTGAMDVSDVSFSSRVPRDLYSGQPHGKREHSGVTFVKPTDKATPLLMKALWTNQKITTGTLSFKKAGGEQYEYLTITLKEVYVASCAFKATDAQETPSETVHIVYKAIEVVYKEQQSKGGMSGQISAADDLARPA